jgi:transcriptional regulator
MFSPQIFVENRPEVLHELVQTHPLGLLITHDGQDMQANAIPWLLDADPAGGPSVASQK